MPAPHIEIALPGIPAHRLLHVPGGEFVMGSADADKDARDNEKPAHRVLLSDFYIGEFVVTQDLWEAVTRENPSRFKGPRRPVENVSWDMIDQKFLPQLRKMTGDASWRLPTEAEWEYAARGGPYWETEDYRYAGSDLLLQVGWYDENSDRETHDVGLLLPNALGLYDMSGNVWEWCSDWYDEKYYEKFRNSRAEDPTGPTEGESAVLRGGSWYDYVYDSRVARRDGNDRNYWYDDLGLRLARAASEGGR